MKVQLLFIYLLSVSITAGAQTCPDYTGYSNVTHEPFSGGRYKLSYQRPIVNCRTFTSQDVENAISRLTSSISDPDLAKLFVNSYPNTLDTAIKWKGYASGSDEELTFVITGDMCGILAACDLAH